MEEQDEEKTKEIHIATQDGDDDESQQDHVPLDLTLEILSRLPATLLVRSLYVSKLWSSFIKLPRFINSFASRSSLRPPRLLLTFSLQGKDEKEKHFVFSFPQHQNPDGSNPPFYIHQMPNPNHWSATVSESIQGLVLLWGFVVWNPTLRRFLTLPQPQETISLKDMSYFGYDPLEGKHKVLFLSTVEYTDQPRVLTLGAKESWRVITKGCPMHCPIGSRGRCFDGVLYYRARVDDNHLITMSFHVKSEKFIPIKFPECGSDLRGRMIIPYEGKLALVPNISSFDNFDIYISEDANGGEWSHKRFLLHVPAPKRDWGDYLCFRGVTDAGELIFACTMRESFHILYFNPRRNSIREAFFEGIMGGEFRRRYGFDNCRIYNVSVFPNHTETLISF